jgi:hypothetical protein
MFLQQEDLRRLKPMKSIVFLFVSAALATSVAAQTSANTQTTGSTQSNTSVSASQSGVHADSTNSTSTSQDVNASKKGNDGSQSGSAAASGSASNHTQAGVDNSGALPSGLTIPAVLNKSLDSKKNKQGDEVSAKTAADVLSQGKIVIPRNTKLIGHVTEAKAKSSGESESTLGIAFDRAILKNGQSVPLNATIQALAAPVTSASSTINDDSYPSSPRSSGGSPTGGGTLGGAPGAVGSVAGGAANTVGGVANGTAASTIDATTRSTAGIGSNTTAGVAGALNSGTTGVIGLKDLQLASSGSSSASGSVITSAGKNVKLESGSQMVLKVGGSADNTASH